MSHLTLETLARLVDEAPNPLESAHLRDCSMCAQELERLRADVAALGALGPIEPADDAWAGLESRLAAEGLIRRPRSATGWYAGALRAAAALALFLVGTAVGATWADERGAQFAVAPDPQTSEQATPADAATPPPTARTASVAVSDDEPAAARDAVGAVPVDAASGEAPVRARVEPEPSPVGTTPAPGSARLASNRDDGPRILGPAPSRALSADELPNTPRDAALHLRDAEAAYLTALANFAQLANDGELNDPVARLAALEGIVLTTREALGRAPADPVINGYHMTALAQREAVLRQIAASRAQPWF